MEKLTTGYEKFIKGKELNSSRPRWSSPAEPLFGLVTNNRSQATAKPFLSISDCDGLKNFCFRKRSLE